MANALEIYRRDSVEQVRRTSQGPNIHDRIGEPVVRDDEEEGIREHSRLNAILSRACRCMRGKITKNEHRNKTSDGEGRGYLVIFEKPRRSSYLWFRGLCQFPQAGLGFVPSACWRSSVGSGTQQSPFSLLRLQASPYRIASGSPASQRKTLP